MNITHEKVKNLENQVINKIVYFIMNKENLQELNDAKKNFERIFKDEENHLNEEGFLIWLIWDYKIDGEHTFIEKFIKRESDNCTKKELEIINSIINSEFSIYKILKVKENIILKDIFSNIEFIIEDTINYIESDNNNMLIGRVYRFENRYFVLDDNVIIDKSFKTMIEKNIYEKYETYKSKYLSSNIKNFIKMNTFLIHKFGLIINRLSEEEQSDNINNYMVWQSVYLYKFKDTILDYLLKSDLIEMYNEEDSISYLRLFDSGRKKILAEIVLTDNKMEIESNSEKDLSDAKFLIERLTESNINHLKDETLSINDLL